MRLYVEVGDIRCCIGISIQCNEFSGLISISIETRRRASALSTSEAIESKRCTLNEPCPSARNTSHKANTTHRTLLHELRNDCGTNHPMTDVVLREERHHGIENVALPFWAVLRHDSTNKEKRDSCHAFVQLFSTKLLLLRTGSNKRGRACGYLFYQPCAGCILAMCCTSKRRNTSRCVRFSNCWPAEKTK